MASNKLKANFAIEHKYGAFYTGGTIQMCASGSHIFSKCSNQVKIVHTETGQVQHTIGQEGDGDMSCFSLSPDEVHLVVAGHCLMLKQWNWRENTLMRTWRAIHTSPVSSMNWDSTSTLLATGGSDATVKVWDVVKQYCTHNLRGHTGVVSAVVFHPNTALLRLFTASNDYNLRVWDLRTSSLLAVLEGHYSVITSIVFSDDQVSLFTGSRDSTVGVWDASTLTKSRIIPVYESVEAVIPLPPNGNDNLKIKSIEHAHFVTAGSKGLLRVWDSQTSELIYTHQENEEESCVPYTFSQACPSLGLAMTVTSEQNIILHELEEFSMHKHFMGNSDDVLDVAFLGTNDSHVVVASNSSTANVFARATWDCQPLKGHVDIIMGLAVNKNGNRLATCSKDNSVRIWEMQEGRVVCVAVGLGHTNGVNTVAFSHLSDSFLVSGGVDLTIKMWKLSDTYSDSGLHHLVSTATERAHDKDINSVVVAPNDKLICSGSQDRTAKLWGTTDITLLGVFKGHKRGIWCVQFSPVDQCVATASADGQIKMWALSDFTCVKTFEGHDASVLRVRFLSRGMQLLSTGSEGLMKLWSIKNNECVQTFDAHEDKVWALASSKSEDVVVTGGGDATIVMWRDVTETEAAEARKEQEQRIVHEQILANLIHEKKWLKALRLAIRLDQPLRVLNIINEVMDSGEESEELLGFTLHKLRIDQQSTLLGYAAKWNTNSHNCHTAQRVLYILLSGDSVEELLEVPSTKGHLEALLPYTERHMERLTRLLQKSTFIDYTWQVMNVACVSAENGDTSTCVNDENGEMST